jgi:hypothetical protein
MQSGNTKGIEIQTGNYVISYPRDNFLNRPYEPEIKIHEIKYVFPVEDMGLIMAERV